MVPLLDAGEPVQVTPMVRRRRPRCRADPGGARGGCFHGISMCARLAFGCGSHGESPLGAWRLFSRHFHVRSPRLRLRLAWREPPRRVAVVFTAFPCALASPSAAARITIAARWSDPRGSLTEVRDKETVPWLPLPCLRS